MLFLSGNVIAIKPLGMEVLGLDINQNDVSKATIFLIKFL